MDDKTFIAAGYEIISTTWEHEDGEVKLKREFIPLGTPEYDEAEKRIEDNHRAYLKARETRRLESQTKIASLLKGSPVRKVTLDDDGAVILHVNDNHSVKVTTYDEGYEWDVE
jgi:hypothetical protein